MKYTVGNPILSGGEITGYEVIDANGNINRLRTEDVVKLINRGLTDSKVVTDDSGKEHITFKYSKVKESDRYTAEFRIVQDGKLVGYKCKNSLGDYKKISPQKVWELAALGCIDNIEAKVVDGKKAIFGKGTDLSDLGVVRI
jgi:hypothetical protein